MTRSRQVTAVVVALSATVLALLALDGPSPPQSLLFADFESLRPGRVSDAAFADEFGGNRESISGLDDSFIVDVGESAGKVYRLWLEGGTIRGSPSSGNHGIALVVPLAKQVDNACIRYHVRFGENFDWSKGGKLPGLSGVAPGVSPTLPAGGGNPGDKGWSGRLVWGSNGSVASYVYHPRQPYKYGQGFGWSQGVDDDRWHVLRQCYRMNTVGQQDGVLRAWLDGAMVLDRTDMVYRLKNTVHISHLMWSIFRGGATDGPDSVTATSTSTGAHHHRVTILSRPLDGRRRRCSRTVYGKYTTSTPTLAISASRRRPLAAPCQSSPLSAVEATSCLSCGTKPHRSRRCDLDALAPGMTGG